MQRACGFPWCCHCPFPTGSHMVSTTCCSVPSLFLCSATLRRSESVTPKNGLPLTAWWCVLWLDGGYISWEKYIYLKEERKWAWREEETHTDRSSFFGFSLDMLTARSGWRQRLQASPGLPCECWSSMPQLAGAACPGALAGSWVRCRAAPTWDASVTGQGLPSNTTRRSYVIGKDPHCGMWSSQCIISGSRMFSLVNRYQQGKLSGFCTGNIWEELPWDYANAQFIHGVLSVMLLLGGNLFIEVSVISPFIHSFVSVRT